ncbi:unnamed protein product [Phytomonas sp. EM1]|nr:unnamed protein product [Phytomonas sp. EM1]|eukprot:CCW63489.1 unnamed protein product [Phytomonas sp. isolate EM1]
MSQENLPVYTWEEVARHDKDDDCWVVLYDRVLDVTKWLNKHPGGFDPIRDMGGMDITNSFETIGHSSTALVQSKSFIIGRVDVSQKDVVKAKPIPEVPKWSEMSKDELYKYKAGGNIIPLWVIVAFICLIIALLYLLL